MVDPAGAIGRAEALRHDALATERAGVLENGRAVALVMLIEGDPVAGVSEQIGEHGLAVLDRLPPEVLAVEFGQVESAEHGGVIVMPIADQIEDREPVRVDDDGLAVERARPHRQARERSGNLRIPGGKICAVACEQPHAPALAPGEDAKAIVLDFVNPAGPRRRLFGRAREAWL